MSCRLNRSPAHKRYLRRLAAFMATYLVTLALAERLVAGGSFTGPLAWLLALLPGLAIVGVFWAVARLLIEETDEYQRMLLVNQTLIASGFALSVATVWGFLENFDLVPNADAFYIAVLFFGGLGLGECVNRLTVERGPKS